MEKSRIEWILKYGLGEISTLPPNLSRIEELLIALIEQGGSGGGSGTTNYNALTNKPSIGGITLQGDVSLLQLNAQETLTFDSVPSIDSENPVTSNGIAYALQGKASINSIPDMTNYYNKTQTDNAIVLKLAEIIADAPEDFNTLKEISDWIENHEESAAAMNSAIQENTRNIENKVDKISGKELSTNDYTTAEKTKLAGIETGANKTTVDSEMNSTSTNPVQNKVVYNALSEKVNTVSGKGLSTNDYSDEEKTKLAGLKNYDDSSVKADISSLKADFRFAYGQMGDTDDFNDYTTSGIYNNSGTNSGQTNFPKDNTSGLLVVLYRVPGHIVQIFFSTYSPDVFVRMQSRGTWDEWKQSALYSS